MNRPSDQTPLPGGYREMWRIAAPLILSMASYTIMQFCDRVFLSRYSSVTIQAALPAGILAHTMICFFQALTGYAGTFTAHFHGAREPVQCVRSTIQGLWLALASWPLILLLIPLGLWMITLSGHAPEVSEAERVYFLILMAGGIMVPLNSAIGGYFMGIGRTMVNMIANAIGCSLNIALNYAMIFGHWGFPEMGIAGAAYATIVSGLVTCLIQLVLFWRESAFRAVGLPQVLKPDGELLARIIRFGTPSGLQLLMDVGSFAVFIMLTGRMGELALASSNIAFSINNLAFAPLLGFGLAASTVVGQHQGAQRPEAARRAGYTGLKMGLIYMCVIGATFVLFPREYFELFRSKDAGFTADELLGLGRTMLLLMTIWGLLDTVSIVLSGALKGAGDTRFVMIYMIIGSWALLVPGSVLLLWAGVGILGLWVWLAVYVCVLAVGFWWRWQQGHWETIRVIEGSTYIPPDTDDIR
ncbi:MAG TPA: MATE family efflux transporter [Kiritimatiellia bacterium]|nr:MATE family efflux transporter [Kiritimatiellia bacterium]HRU70503.1 MATE family efflux transporter [Kiritimatiellia bacterium]